MKRKLVLTSAVVLILALLAAGTFAYFSKDARATNVITTGTINIELNDSITGGTAVKDGDKVTGYTISDVMPGQPVEKIVSVTNTGTSPAWLRVKLDISVTMAAGKTDTWKGENVVTFTPNMNTETGEGWFLAEDGYYYYDKPVAAGASTLKFFAEDSLMLNPQLPNDYQGCTVTVAVQAQAVQVENDDSYTDGDKTVPIKTLTPENVDKIADTFPAAD